MGGQTAGRSWCVCQQSKLGRTSWGTTVSAPWVRCRVTAVGEERHLCGHAQGRRRP